MRLPFFLPDGLISFCFYLYSLQFHDKQISTSSTDVAFSKYVKILLKQAVISVRAISNSTQSPLHNISQVTNRLTKLMSHVIQ
jgi:hypothetical protein